MGKRTERSRNTYDNMAAHYDTSPEGNYTRPHKSELLAQVALGDGDHLLDVACGNGALLEALCKKAHINAYGVDLSEKMIVAARARVPAASFAVGPCTPLPFGSESMDCITVSCAFHHFEDPKAFAAECMRVLKPRGRLYMAEPFFTPVIRWLANTLVFPFSRAGDVKAYSPGELCGIFEAAGFTGTKTHETGSVLFFSAQKSQ